MRSICSRSALAVIFAVPCLFAQGGRGQQPAADPAVVKRGLDTFTSNCAACHGMDARGGRGPDLARSLVVTRDTTGQALREYARVGNPGNGMPPFNLTDKEFSDISVFINATAQAQLARRPPDPASLLVGDRKAGEAYFNGEGKCTGCHSVTGDLKGVGTKYAPVQLQGRIVYPRGTGGYPGFGQAPSDPPYTAAATLPDGRRISGTVLVLSDYMVTIREADGTRHTVNRTAAAKVEIKDPLQAHADRMKILTDRQMHDLTAYLAGVK